MVASILAGRAEVIASKTNFEAGGWRHGTDGWRLEGREMVMKEEDRLI